MGELLNNYSVEVDNVNEVKWNQVLKKFKDANSYQTWHYGIVNYGKENISFFVLRKNDEIVAASLVRVITLPLIKIKIAYIRWGPIWKPKDKSNNYEVFSDDKIRLALIAALRRLN